MYQRLIKSFLFTSILISALLTNFSMANQVEVKLVEPKKFSDIKLSNKSTKQSIKVVKQKFEKLFNKLAKDLVEDDKKLLIEITNIDLPGYIDYMVNSTHDIRIVKRSDIYKLKFNFSLTETNGKNIKSGEKALKGFVSRKSPHLNKNNESVVHYFSKDISAWLESELVD